MIANNSKLQDTIHSLNETKSKLENTVYSFQFLEEFRSGLNLDEETELVSVTKKRNKRSLPSIYSLPSYSPRFTRCPNRCHRIPHQRRLKYCCIHPVCHRNRAAVRSSCDWFHTLQGSSQGNNDIYHCNVYNNSQAPSAMHGPLLLRTAPGTVQHQYLICRLQKTVSLLVYHDHCWRPD